MAQAKSKARAKPALRVVDAERELMRIVVVGHVDHGKSTLIGRLFHDTDSLPEGKYEAIKAMCERRGVAFEWAFLMDAFQAERDQGITIDSSQIWFKSDKRDYTIIDAPGHREFIKNMVTGAAQADAALLVIDAVEGVRQQSRRHGYLLHLLGINQVAVVVNKMDAADFAEARFRDVEREIVDYLQSIGVTPTHVIPVSARDGDNLAARSRRSRWFEGATVVEALDGFSPAAPATDKPFRMPVQDVYKFDERRIIAGRIEQGTVRVGDEILFSPANKTARVRSIEMWSADPAAPVPSEACAGQSVGLTLDEQVFVERGAVASHVEEAPIETDVFCGRVVWLAHEPLETGKRYKMKIGPCEARVKVEKVVKAIDTEDLSEAEARRIERHHVGEVVLRARRLLVVDEFAEAPHTGRFVLVDGYQIAGGGIVSMEGYADQRELITQRATNISRVAHGVAIADREVSNGHRGGVLWLTGLSGAGKSTLAVALERRLHEKGYQAFVLDGDNVRHGLNANLGFTPEDRAENIRRVGEVAALFSRAGMVAITAFISPYRSDRRRAREAAGGKFHEIHIKADLETCEARDPKGLYRKARAGEIADFTGISAPYEPPEKPDLVIDTATRPVEECLDELVAFVNEHFAL